MSPALEAIRKELATLRPRVDVLEKAEALLMPAYEPVEPPAPKTPTVAPKRPRRRSPTRAQVRKHVTTHGPMTRGEILAALGGSAGGLDTKLHRLLKDGEIGADGRPRARRYRAPDGTELPKMPPTPSVVLPRRQATPDRGTYPVYDAIVDLGGASKEQLAEQTGLPKKLVVQQGRRLLQLGLIEFTGVGDERTWLATPTTERDDVV